MVKCNGFGQLIVGGPPPRMLGVHYSMHNFAPDDVRGTIQLVFSVGELKPGLTCQLVTADGQIVRVEVIDAHGDFLFFRAVRDIGALSESETETSNSRHKPVE